MIPQQPPNRPRELYRAAIDEETPAFFEDLDETAGTVGNRRCAGSKGFNMDNAEALVAMGGHGQVKIVKHIRYR